jgi:hypothetical protein
MKFSYILTSCLLVLFTLLTSGCIGLSWNLKKERQELSHEIVKKDDELNRHLRAYVTGTVDSLSISEKKQTEHKIALNFAQKAQEIVGLPHPGDKIHVTDIIQNNEDAIDNLADRDSEVIALSRQKEVLGHELKDTEDKLIELGESKGSLNQGFFAKAWAWLLGTFGLIGAIAILVIGGPALLPIIGQILAWAVTKIPPLVSWMGLTSFSLTKNIIRGIHDTKEKIKMADEEKKFSKTELLDMFRTNLGNTTNHSDKNIISRIKRKF